MDGGPESLGCSPTWVSLVETRVGWKEGTMAGWRVRASTGCCACLLCLRGREGWCSLGTRNARAPGGHHAPVPAHAGRSRETASGTSTRSPAAPGPSSVPLTSLGPWDTAALRLPHGLARTSSGFPFPCGTFGLPFALTRVASPFGKASSSFPGARSSSLSIR